MDVIKLKIFYSARKTINKMKRQPTECEKIFPNEVTDKGLILLNIQTARIALCQKNNPIKK